MLKNPFYKPRLIVSTYFGVPGSGKTTFAAWLAKRDMKYGIDVYSNVPIKGCYKLDARADIGKHQLDHARVIIDEAGLEFGNRDFKSFTHEQMYWFKFHRHYTCAVDVFSQGWDDCDKKIRTLSQRYYVVSKSLIPFFIKRKRIKKRVGVSEITGEIIDEYYFQRIFGTRYIFAPSVWGMFDTHEAKKLLEHKYDVW